MLENGDSADIDLESGQKENDDRVEATVDLGEEASLKVDISDALSEKERVKFTVHTRTSLADYAKSDFTCSRDHEEFIWLHDIIRDEGSYAGIIIPPPPPRPDFAASREKLQKLGESEATLSKEEYQKMKAELEAEYLATFKKTVAMHEVFLQRIAAHPILKKNYNFKVFLEHEGELAVRGPSAVERVSHWMSRVGKSADEVLLAGQKDVDDFFEHEKNYLVEYHSHILDATKKADKKTRIHKTLADGFIKVAVTLDKMATAEHDQSLQALLVKVSDTFEKSRKLESRVSSDEDLKQSDVLRYFMKDTNAAKDLLYRRMRSLADYEGANKTLERARAKNKDVQKAEDDQKVKCETFEKISEEAKGELTDFKKRRVMAFKKGLVDLADLQTRHAKAHLHLLNTTIESLKNEVVA